MANNTFVINVGRQLGAGGRTIGHRLAETFRAGYYDKEILSLAAQDSGMSKEMFERTDEHKSFFRSVFGTIAPVISSDFYGNQLSDENLFRIQSDAIRKEASRHSCVFIGRCADYVLREHPRRVSIFISASLEDRLRRVMEVSKCSRKEAMKIIENGDRARADFYNFYSNKTWGVADTYDLCINSSALGIDGTFEIVRDFVARRLGITLTAE